MKNGNKEVRLVYRKLSDPFFIINKPVNWTLKEKIVKHKENTECLSCYKCVKNENEAYKNVLKKLSVVEKNTFLYTNSTSLCYNNLRFSINQNGSKETYNKKKNEKGEILEINGINKYVESYYVESLLKNETDRTLFYPYKLPLYMSGLIICCSDYFIYQKFLHLIKENKVIQKYRCLINNPLPFVNSYKHIFAINNSSSEYYGSARSRTNKINDSELRTNDKFQNEKKTQKKKNKEEKTFEDIETKIHIKKYTRYINGLIAQKKVNDLFPYHNFYDNNSVSKNYWNYITDLEINKWKKKINLLMNQKNEENHINSSLGRKKKTTQHPLDIYEEKRKKKPTEEDHFVQVFLKKSEPVKSLNTIFTYIFSYDNCNDFFAWKKKSTKRNYDKKKKTENLDLLLSDLHNFNFQKMWSLHKNKLKPPLSLFFNEGTFYRLEEKNQTNSCAYSMIYKMYNYKDYLQKEKLWKAEKNEKGVTATAFENLLLIEFILLDLVKPDLIRFFFNEMKTPIINDNIFDKTNFKKDIINQAILEKEKNEDMDSAIDIFGNACTQYNEKTFNNNTHNNNDEHKHNDYIRNAFKSDIKTYSMPYNNDTFNNTQEKHKIQLNSYFVHESEKYENISDSCEKDSNIKTNNICLELYQLQFCDPISNEYVQIENSLPSEWF